MPAVLNAANEVAVAAFLDRAIPFTEIARIVEKTMEKFSVVNNPGLEDIFNADHEARVFSKSLAGGAR
jgi:1-deoxy-D-xylulose-5-phosphate reductoisomerase